MLVPVTAKASGRGGQLAAILSILTLPGLEETKLAEWRSDLASRPASRPDLRRLSARLGRPDVRRRPGLRSWQAARFIDDFDRIDQDQVGTGVHMLQHLLTYWRYFNSGAQIDKASRILKSDWMSTPEELADLMAAYLADLSSMHTATEAFTLLRELNEFKYYCKKRKPGEPKYRRCPASLKEFRSELSRYRFEPSVDLALMSVPQAEHVITDVVRMFGIFKEAPAIVRWLDQQHYASNVKLRLREYAATRDIEDWTEWIDYFDAQDSENPFTKAREFCTTKATEAARQEAEALWNLYKETIHAKLAAAGAGQERRNYKKRLITRWFREKASGRV